MRTAFEDADRQFPPDTTTGLFERIDKKPGERKNPARG